LHNLLKFLFIGVVVIHLMHADCRS